MTKFRQSRLHVEVIPVEDDLVTLVDINRSLREEAVTLLLEVSILREHMERRAAGIKVLSCSTRR